MAAAGVTLHVLDPEMLQFIPRPFGSLFQVVINATSFSSIVAQLHEVLNSAQLQQDDQDAPPISLLTGSCFTNNGSYHGPNCTSACADPATMFNSSFTFFNCLTLGAATVLSEAGDISITDDSVAVAGDHLGFDGLETFDGKQILEDTLMCVKASCQDYSLGACDMNINLLNISSSVDPVTDLYNGLQSYCSGAASIVNSDIAGPGVSYSYFPQITE